jgi:hypothetical protein
MQDYSGISPLTGLCIISSEDPNEINAESRNHCFSLNFHLCKESKEMMMFHAPMVQFCENCGDSLTNPLGL